MRTKRYLKVKEHKKTLLPRLSATGDPSGSIFNILIEVPFLSSRILLISIYPWQNVKMS
jgi:hypothetical protein